MHCQDSFKFKKPLLAIAFFANVMYNVYVRHIKETVMKKPELVIMAAGMGSRYGGLKQIDSVDDNGHIIIDFSIYDAIRAGFGAVTFIIKKEIDRDFREVMDAHLAGKNIEVKYVYQELDMLPDGFSLPEGRKKPWGTAHALLCCDGVVNAPFAVINADDYYGAHAFEKMYSFLTEERGDDKYHFAMIGYRIKNTVTEQGTVSRGICTSDGNGMLTEIVERSNIGVRGDEIYYLDNGIEHFLDGDTLVSMNLWGFTPEYISECKARFPKFLKENLDSNPEKCEFYLPFVVSQLIRDDKADVKVIENSDKWYGVTYKEDKPSVVAAFKELKEQGVYPENF